MNQNYFLEYVPRLYQFWERIPKHTFVTLVSLKFGVNNAAANFNNIGMKAALLINF